MCGIAGIFDFAGRPIDAELSAQACATMRHRGPDDHGVWTDARPELSAMLASTRLAVIDPTPAGHQPMLRDGGRFAMVLNGIIYNYRELRDELAAEGDVFTSRCDTEVALAACARWGHHALPRFNGMWALAFSDSHRRTGFLARDRFGIKPLFWTRHAQRLAFASEMRTLMELGEWPHDIDPAALTHYMRFGYIVHPQTIYTGVHRLPPATFMTFNATSVEPPSRYYTLPGHQPDAATPDPVEAGERIRRAMFESVARHRVADVPTGAFLSGGLDSSIIVAHLAELSGHAVQTFSIGWADESAYDETRYARLVAERFGTEHHELKCRSHDVLAILPDLLDHLGEPFFDSSILPTAILSEFARRHVTVCLSGDGGDELMGGYWRYLAQGMYDTYQNLPRLLRSLVIEPLMAQAPTSKGSVFQNRIRQFRKLLRAGGHDAIARHIAWSEILAPEARDVLHHHDARDPVLERFDRDTAMCDATDTLNRIFAFDMQNSLPSDMLHKVDLASMYHSLEVRVPFLDPGVVEATMTLPSRLKIDRGRNKAVLKQAYRGILPDEILNRPKKGFEVPIGEFLRYELREMFLDTVTKPTIESFGMLNYAAVRRVYDDHCARRGEHADLLFALLSLCWWRRNNSVSAGSSNAPV